VNNLPEGVDEKTLELLHDLIHESTIDNEIIEDIFRDEYISTLRFLLLHDFKAFVRIFFFIKTKKHFIFKDFHDDIVDSFQDLVFGRAEKPYLMINIPPRFGKTELASFFCAWGFAISPSSEFIYTSYSDDLVLAVSASIRDAVIKTLHFNRLFNVNIIPSQDSKKQWVTRERGNFYAVTIGGAVTGMGAGSMEDKFDGALVIDDSIKLQDATSKVARDKVIENFKTTLSNRLNDDDVSNKFTTPIVIVAQLTHAEDFCCWFEENYKDTVKIIRVKALNDDNISIWQKKKSSVSLLRMKEIDSYNFYTQFQQTPQIKGGNIVKEDWICHYENLPDDITDIYLSADLAIKAKETNDYTVITVWGVHKFNRGKVRTRHYYLLDMYREKKKFPIIIKATEDLVKKYKPKKLIIEDKANGSALTDMIENKIGRKMIVPILPKKDKEYRLESCADYFYDSKVFFDKKANYTKDVVHELTNFPGGVKNDDIVDSISQFLNYMSTVKDYCIAVSDVDI